jgi:hypothetical protein
MNKTTAQQFGIIQLIHLCICIRVQANAAQDRVFLILFLEPELPERGVSP